MKNFIISLATASDRRQHIKNEFSKQGIDFEFFDAVTPAQIDELSQKFDINIKDASLTKGELGCLFSHISLWQKMIDENLAYMTIFEDDVYLGKNAQLFLTSYDWIPKECKLLKLEHFFNKLILGKTLSKYQNRSIRRLKYANLGTAGYIIHQDMAKDLIIFIQQNFKQQSQPIDHIMFEFNLNQIPAYQLSPALCIQSDRLNQNTLLPSDLEQERNKIRENLKSQKASLTPIQKFIREFKRIFRNSYHFIFSSKTSFQ